MQHKSFADMECCIARALDETGDWWSMLILRTAFLGARRFQTFQEHLGIAPTTLTRRLELLTEHGLLARRRYSEHPPREEYELTPKGLDFLPVLVCLGDWGGRWLAPAGAPMEFVDAETGQLVDPVVVDRRTGRELAAGTVALRAGPGATEDLKRALSTPVVLGGKLEERA
jgi:DNA-binding HxlR family transcriptional regulator